MSGYLSPVAGLPIADLVLWKWNETDLSQIGAEVGSHTGTLTPSVVSDGEMPSRNRIRLVTSGSFQGHAFLPIVGLSLPRRFIARVRLHVQASVGAGGDNLVLLVVTNLVAGLSNASLYGMQIAIDGNGTNYVIEAGARDTAGTVSMTASGTLSTAALQSVGIAQEYYIDRAPDPNPQAEPRFNFHRQPSTGPNAITPPPADAVGSGMYTTTFDAGWNGLTLDRAGLGISTSNAVDTTWEISELEFLRHPMEYDAAA